MYLAGDAIGGPTPSLAFALHTKRRPGRAAQNRKKVATLDKSEEYSEFFGSAKINEHGQITIPAQARKNLGLKPGDRLLVAGHHSAGTVILLKMDSLDRTILPHLKKERV